MAKLVFQSLAKNEVEECAGEISLKSFRLLSIPPSSWERGVGCPAHRPPSTLAGVVIKPLRELGGNTGTWTRLGTPQPGAG